MHGSIASSFRSGLAVTILSAAASSCALYSHVSISPLHLKPGDVTPPAANVTELVAKGDYNRAIQWGPRVLESQSPSWRDLAALGRAMSSTGRHQEARPLLRRALDMRPPLHEAALIAWDASQNEFMRDDFVAAKEWVDYAAGLGLSVRPWYPKYLEAMATIDAYRLEGAPDVRVPMRSVSPEIPRIDVLVNGGSSVTGVIDSGAVLTIVSDSLARRHAITIFDEIDGTFYGLLEEPISVRFGLIDSMQIGGMTLRNVPVAVMPDRKLSFFVGNDEPMKLDLLLGANLLKNFRIQIDYWHESVGFTYVHPSMRRPAADANLFFVNLKPFVHATIENRGWYLLLLDTGSEITYLNADDLMKMRIRSVERSHDAKLQGLGGSQKQGSKIERVSIGLDQWNGKFRDIALYRSRMNEAAGIIGEDFLRNFLVTIDFGRMRVDLQRDPDRDPYARMQQQILSTTAQYP